MFSSRLPAALAPNAISRAVDELRARGVRLLDLTATNPTLVGLRYPAGFLEGLSDERGALYQPEPLGLWETRVAVAEFCSRNGTRVDPARVVLTTSTSEAYALLFKLLCNPGDAVMAPRPSYPLFESLTALEGVAQIPYWLHEHGRWSIDRNSLEDALTPCSKAVLVVSPNNPTGSMLRESDREWLVRLCLERDVAIIADEVFADYPLRPGPDAVSLSGEARALTFVLGGLSKTAGLPQVKLGWIVVNGPDGLAKAALDRLELICDTYLSVSTSVQHAAPALLLAGHAIRAEIQARIAQNLAAAERLIRADSPVSLIGPEAGWSLVLRVPATSAEESLVLQLLRDAGVIVHPGFFFDFAREAFLVISLLPEPAVFEEGLQHVLAAVQVGRPQ